MFLLRCLPLNHLNTRLAWYSNGYCIITLDEGRFIGSVLVNCSWDSLVIAETIRIPDTQIPD